MSRSVRFFFVVFIVFLMLIFLINSFLSSPEEEVVQPQVVEPIVEIYTLTVPVQKKQIVSSNNISIDTYKISELKGLSYSPTSELPMPAGTLFKRDIPAGTYLTADDIISPDHSDYLFFSLKEDELPYWYDVTELIESGALTVTSGDYVSFMLTQLSPEDDLTIAKPSTLLSSDPLLSNMIITQAKVLKLIKYEKDSSVQRHQLALALTLNEIMLLESAMITDQQKKGHLKLLLTSNVPLKDKSIIDVYRLNRDVAKGQLIDRDDLSIHSAKKSELKMPYNEVDNIILLDGAVFKKNLKADAIISTEHIANTTDADYPLFFLQEGELPYWFDITNLIINEALTVKSGDYVSFILTPLLSDLDSTIEPELDSILEPLIVKPSSSLFPPTPLLGKMVIKQAKVLKLISSEKIPSYQLLLALSLDEIIDLESAIISEKQKKGHLKLLLTSNVPLRDKSIIDVYTLNQDVTKGQLINRNDFSIYSVKKSELEIPYSEVDDIILLDGAVFKEDLKADAIVSTEHIANTSDADYPLFFLQEGELPYWFDVTTLIEDGAFAAKTGDVVSFILEVTDEKSPQVWWGESKKDFFSEVIIEKARVLHLNLSPKSQQLVVALNSKNILQLNAAKSMGEISVILSSNLKEERFRRNFYSGQFIPSDLNINTLRGGK